MIQFLKAGRSDVARDILEALPEWFGNSKARETYIQDVINLPMLVSMRDKQPVGFLSLKAHSAQHREVRLMGVYPEFRRSGIGRALVDRAVHTCQSAGVCSLSVKTLAASVPDPHYAETRAFYLAMGFQFHEELPTIWGPETPCAVYMMALNEKRRPILRAPS